MKLELKISVFFIKAIIYILRTLEWNQQRQALIYEGEDLIETIEQQK